jgi:hypothetical protein
MARPACPLCADAYSVVKISRLHRTQPVFPEPETPEQPLLPDSVAPPGRPAAPGKYLGLAAVIGVLLWVASGFTLLCLALALCIGASLEAALHWDQVQALDAYRRAQAIWRAAYYCSTHDRVFLPETAELFVPMDFAHLLRGEPLAVEPRPGRVRATADVLPQAEIGSASVAS